MELVKIKFLGKYKVIADLPGFGKGLINPDDIITTTKDNYEKELKKNLYWELVKEEKMKSNKIKEEKR